MLWLRKGFGFSGEWSVNDQNDLIALLFGLQKVNKHEIAAVYGVTASIRNVCDTGEINLALPEHEPHTRRTLSAELRVRMTVTAS